MSGTPRAAIDASALPTVSFGTRDLGWWSTVAFMLIEGTTIAACLVCHIYLKQNFSTWPPTIPPDLGAATANTLLLLVIMVPMLWAGHAARRLDLRRVRLALTIAVALSALAVVLRCYEFGALNVRWDQNAYGSTAWASLGFHTSLLVMDLLETLVLTLIFYIGPVEKKHFSDTDDSAMYQVFLSLAYLPIYLLVFLLPRWTR
jgi:heme/copper-type cytochrome/quinol oxidase subunit 3